MNDLAHGKEHRRQAHPRLSPDNEQSQPAFRDRGEAVIAEEGRSVEAVLCDLERAPRTVLFQCRRGERVAAGLQRKPVELRAAPLME